MFGDDDPVRPAAEVEKIMIEHAMRRFDGCVKAAALKLGLARATIYRLVDKYDLRHLLRSERKKDARRSD